jgi:hypothetical protein
MQRREFLKSTGMAAIAAAATGPFVHATDKSGSKPVVIGAGEHTYECHHNWGEVPGSIHWVETHGIAVDGEGLVYVTHRAGGEKPKSPSEAQDTVAVFEPSGKFVRSFGKEWHGGGHGIDVRTENGQEVLYLAQMFPVNLLVKTDLKGNVIWQKDRNALMPAHVYDNPETRFSPTNVAFGADGGFYLGDGYGSSYIHQFDREANWIRTWGGAGTEPGKMQTPHGLWVDARPGREPSLVVADRANARLQYFTLDGKHLGFVNEVLFPAHFDIRGEILLVPDLHARLSLFDKDNKAIVHLGDDPAWITEVKKLQIRSDPSKWVDGKFVHPHDACFDRDGNIYVAEWVSTGRVSFLKKVS